MECRYVILNEVLLHYTHYTDSYYYLTVLIYFMEIRIKRKIIIQ